MSEGVTSPGVPSELSSPSFRGSPAQSPPPVATTVHTSLKNRTTSAIYDNALYDAFTPTSIHGSISLRRHDVKDQSVPTPSLSFTSQHQFTASPTHCDGLTATEVRRGVQWAKLSASADDNLLLPVSFGMSQSPTLASTGHEACSTEPLCTHQDSQHPEKHHGIFDAKPGNFISNALHDLHSSPTPGRAAEVAQMLFSAPSRSCQLVTSVPSASHLPATPCTTPNQELRKILADCLSGPHSQPVVTQKSDLADLTVLQDTPARLQALLCTPSAHESPSISIDPLYCQLLNLSGEGEPMSDSMTPISNQVNEQTRPGKLHQPCGQSSGGPCTLFSTGIDLARGSIDLDREQTGGAQVDGSTSAHAKCADSKELSRQMKTDSVLAVSTEDVSLLSCDSFSPLDAEETGQERHLPGDGRMQRQSKSQTRAWTAHQPHGGTHGVQVPYISADQDTLSRPKIQAYPTPGSWLISGQGIRESFDRGPESLPELSDEQFEHACTTTGPGQESTVSHIHRKCTVSKESEGLRQCEDIITSPCMKPNQVLAEPIEIPCITDEIDAEDSKDSCVLKCGIDAQVIDLAPPARSDLGMHPLSSNGPTVTSTGDWMPMFVDIASKTSPKVGVPRASVAMPRPEGCVVPATASPCLRSLRSSSQTTGGIPRPRRKKPFPCPPLPRRPSFGASASPGNLPPRGSLQFTPDVASPKLGRCSSASCATHSPQSLPRQLGSRPRTVPLPVAMLKSLRALDQGLCGVAGIDHLNNSVSPIVTEYKAEVVTQDSTSKQPTSCKLSEKERHREPFVIRGHPSFQHTGSDVADAELEDLSSPESGESSKENGPLAHSGPGLDESRLLPPVLSSLSPVRPGFKRFPVVFGVRYDDLDAKTSDLGDPALSPGNPDCGNRWSLNSPPPLSGLLKRASASFPDFEQDKAGTINGQFAKTSTENEQACAVHCINKSQNRIPIFPGMHEIPVCSTPLAERHDGDHKEAPCRSIHVSKSPCQHKASFSARFSPGPLHVLPSRGGQHAGGCDSAANRGGWDFQMPDRTPLNIHLEYRHGTVLDEDGHGRSKRSRFTKNGSIHDTVWHEIEVNWTSGAFRPNLLEKVWRTLCWATLCITQSWDSATLAWRTAEVPEESWVLLGVFVSLLGIYRMVSSVLAIVIHGQHDGAISNTQWSEGARAHDAALLPSITLTRPSFYNRCINLQDQHSFVVGTDMKAVSDSADAILPLHSLTAESVTSGGEAASQSAQHSTPGNSKIEPNNFKDPEQCPRMASAMNDHGQHSFMSPTNQDCALHSLVARMNPRTQCQDHLHASAEILLPSAVQDRINQVIVVPEVPRLSFCIHNHKALQFLRPPCAEGESACMSDARLTWRGSALRRLQEKGVNGRACALGISCSHVPAPWDVYTLQVCVDQTSDEDRELSCGVSWSASSGVFGSERREPLNVEDLHRKHQDTIYYSAFDGLLSSRIQELHAFAEVVGPNPFTIHNVGMAVGTGSNLHGDPWLLSSGIVWLTSALCIGCISAISSAYFKHNHSPVGKVNPDD